MTIDSPLGTPRLGDLRRRAASARWVGREAELGQVAGALLGDEVRVAFVHGLGGIGKSSFLDALDARLAGAGMTVLRCDGLSVAPTPGGMLEALGSALGLADVRLADLVRGLEAFERGVAILIDEYDSLRLLDAWIRRELLPALPAGARVVLAGRNRPVASWTTTPGWDAIVTTLELGPLREQDARQLVEREGVGAERVARVVALAAGHPLAIKLASAAVRARPDLPLAEIESRHVLSELVRRHLDERADSGLRTAVEAASVLRRVNRPLLASLLCDATADRALALLAEQPFVDEASDGLVIHPSVRNAVSSALRSVDPDRHRELRIKAWSRLAEDLDREPVGAARRWSVTADVVYLLDDPSVREAFFPTDTIRFGVEPATPADRDAVFAIAREHAGQEETTRLAAWWSLLPSAFSVVRDASGRVQGFYVAAFFSDVPPALLAADPLLAGWVQDAAIRFPGGRRPVLCARTMLSAADGAEPSEERAACFLDVKRAYMEHLDLAAMYTAQYHGGEALLCERFGFERIDALTIPSGPGGDVTTAVLDFGPGVLHWLRRMIDAQWAGRPLSALPKGMMLCRDARELLVDGERRPLTRLEFGLLDHLDRQAGAVCTRDELLASVWGQAHTGSNVVDAVVRSIRKKLGEHARVLQTVTGHGYRLRKD